MSSKAKSGFTIIELMMVVGIIGILLGIVVNAAQSSIKQARRHKADSVCKIVEQALATYYAQYGYWPEPMKSKVVSGSFGDKTEYDVTRSEADGMIRELVKEVKNGNPLMNVSGLYVSKTDREPQYERCPRHGSSTVYRYYPAKGVIGMDFTDALRGTKQNPKKMRVSEMHFGYPHSTGKGFMPFHIIYNTQADTMTVHQWHWCD